MQMDFVFLFGVLSWVGIVAGAVAVAAALVVMVRDAIRPPRIQTLDLRATSERDTHVDLKKAA